MRIVASVRLKIRATFATGVLSRECFLSALRSVPVQRLYPRFFRFFAIFYISKRFNDEDEAP